MSLRALRLMSRGLLMVLRLLALRLLVGIRLVEKLAEADLVDLVDPLVRLAVTSLEEEGTTMDPRVVSVPRLVREVRGRELTPLETREMESPTVGFYLLLEVHTTEEDDIISVVEVEGEIFADHRDLAKSLVEVDLFPFHGTKVECFVGSEIAVKEKKSILIVSAEDLVAGSFDREVWVFENKSGPLANLDIKNETVGMLNLLIWALPSEDKESTHVTDARRLASDKF